MPGYLAAGLQLRKERGLRPITIISCDNIAGNGHQLHASVTHIARKHDPRLAEWIERNCAFPEHDGRSHRPGDQRCGCEADKFAAWSCRSGNGKNRTLLPMGDRGPVRRPPARSRIGGRSDHNRRLRNWEQAKLRLLNGAHSAMAYLGGLAGIDTVDQFVEQPWGRGFVRPLWDELESTLTPPRGLDVAEYRRTLMRRFGNSALRHRLRQIAIDGSQKIPQRLVTAAADLLDRGRQPDAIALAIAAWMRWQSGRDDLGHRFDVDDPLASTTERLSTGAANAADQARALLSLRSVFPTRLRDNSSFHELVAGHLQDLRERGAQATVERFLSRQTVAAEGKRCG